MRLRKYFVVTASFTFCLLLYEMGDLIAISQMRGLRHSATENFSYSSVAESGLEPIQILHFFPTEAPGLDYGDLQGTVCHPGS